ncbi:MAG: type II toxin-antitoxin system RelE/ParE family toxin [Bacteroidota bacterium]
MVTYPIRIVWDKTAVHSFENAISYIGEDSPGNPEKVKKRIQKKVDDLLKHPKRHQLDKLKTDNDGNYRVFIESSYRVSYLISEQEIIIIRVRHCSMEPLEY